MATKVLVSMNAFKGSISTRTATDTVAAAFVAAGFEVEKIYLADGGDGTADVASALRESQVEVQELTLEKGRLDDVFRMITTADGARHA